MPDGEAMFKSLLRKNKVYCFRGSWFSPLWCQRVLLCPLHSFTWSSGRVSTMLKLLFLLLPIYWDFFEEVPGCLTSFCFIWDKSSMSSFGVWALLWTLKSGFPRWLLKGYHTTVCPCLNPSKHCPEFLSYSLSVHSAWRFQWEVRPGEYSLISTRPSGLSSVAWLL